MSSLTILGPSRVFDTAPAATPPRCEYCGRPQGASLCIGEDQCFAGPDGGPAHTCAGWGQRCCRCGAAFARGQWPGA